MKQQISQSKFIQNELKDGGLRQLIDSIDCASDVDDDSKPHGYKGQQQKKASTKQISPRVLALARTKHRHPKFASFVDEMLLTAGVLQPAITSGGGGGEKRLASILEGQGGGRGPLVLAPVPRHGCIDNSESSSNECKSNSGESDSSSDDDNEEDSDSSEEDSESEGEVKE